MKVLGYTTWLAMPHSTHFKVFAMTLWVLVAALLALNMVVLFHWPLRWAIFFLAFNVGVVLLVGIHWPLVRPQKIATTLPSGEHLLLEARRSPPPASVPQLKLAETKLTPDQAREWLDDFLVKQQQK